MTNLTEFDLNLLLAFEALLLECDVSRAAERAGLARPSMNRSLARLRIVFGDDLFVRTPEGIRPTTRALALAGPIRGALARTRDALNVERGFDPASARRRFAVGCMYYANFTSVPRFVQMLAREAPGVDFCVYLHHGTDEAVRMLDYGRTELAIGTLRDLPSRVHSQQVGIDHPVCISRYDHPDLLNGLDLDMFVRLPHIRVSDWQEADEEVDAALARRGRKRHIRIAIPTFYPLVIAVEYSDMLAVVPAAVAQALALHVSISIHEIPLEVPRWPLMMAWPATLDQDPGIDWLRSFVSRVHENTSPELAHAAAHRPSARRGLL
jgi:DNA-binding transcriptional LysR family regulator